jgi:fluoroacetyl-CoA thioesterase
MRQAAIPWPRCSGLAIPDVCYAVLPLRAINRIAQMPRKYDVLQRGYAMIAHGAPSCWGLCPAHPRTPRRIASPVIRTYGADLVSIEHGTTMMKQSLRPGACKVIRLEVDAGRTIAFMGEEGRVYATPELVRDIEYTCRDLLLEHAEVGEDSVGMGISVTHTAPTLLGMQVEITTTVATVEGRKVTFDVSAKDELETIGAGSHTRFVVDVSKTHERLRAKAARRARRVT